MAAPATAAAEPAGGGLRVPTAAWVGLAAAAVLLAFAVTRELRPLAAGVAMNVEELLFEVTGALRVPVLLLALGCLGRAVVEQPPAR